MEEVQRTYKKKTFLYSFQNKLFTRINGRLLGYSLFCLFVVVVFFVCFVLFLFFWWGGFCLFLFFSFFFFEKPVLEY